MLWKKENFWSSRSADYIAWTESDKYTPPTCRRFLKICYNTHCRNKLPLTVIVIDVNIGLDFRYFYSDPKIAALLYECDSLES